jgi:hypothetical protein
MEEESKGINQSRVLAVYLLIAALLQICLYVTLSLPRQNLGWMFYFDPRMGIFVVDSVVRGSELNIPGIFQWASALWLLVIALMLLKDHLMLKTYIFSEIILFLPNLLFILVVAIANLDPEHGFSIHELSLPVMVMLFFSIIPLTFAVHLILKNRELHRSSLRNPRLILFKD